MPAMIANPLSLYFLRKALGFGWVASTIETTGSECVVNLFCEGWNPPGCHCRLRW